MFRIVKNKNARFSRYMNLFSKGGGSSPPVTPGDALLLEDGASFILLEDGASKLLMEA